MVCLLAQEAKGEEEEEEEEEEEGEEEGVLVCCRAVGGRRVGRLEASEVGTPAPGDGASSVRCRRRFIMACLCVCQGVEEREP